MYHKSRPMLYLVPTPVGNLKDMTYRAVEVLKEVAHILAEDTRTSGRLLKHLRSKLLCDHIMPTMNIRA